VSSWTTRTHPPGRAVSAIVAVRLTSSPHNRWVDVRGFASFTGCTDAQIRTAAATRQLPRLLEAGAIHARIARA
jgi:hypothetical protein